MWSRLNNFSGASLPPPTSPQPRRPARGQARRSPLLLEQLEDRTTPSFGLSALHLGTSAGSIDYDYTAGNRIVPTGTVDAGKFFDLVVTRSDGSKFTASTVPVGT